MKSRRTTCVLLASLALGCGALIANAADAPKDNKGLTASKTTIVDLGPEFADAEISEILRREAICAKKCTDVEGEVASRLAAGKVVARFAGRMEYGPRALGNRSILCEATDPSTNARLNARLKRTEFMPFAPVVRRERLPDYFTGADKCPMALEFMTVTLNATEKCRQEAPAIVHLDGTARPQVIRRSVNPSYYNILKRYEEMTGLGILINTSFNVHEEPIVNTPGEALEVFRTGKLDTLVLGEYLIDRRSEPEDRVDFHRQRTTRT